MTRKRYINIARAIFTEICKNTNSSTIYKGWERAFRNLGKNLRDNHPNGFCYEEMFNQLFRDTAHRYSIGGY